VSWAPSLVPRFDYLVCFIVGLIVACWLAGL